jgi:uncharacterized damage-inducible protein DinB
MHGDTVDSLRDELRRSLHGPAWHGPALLEVLCDLSPREAQARPLHGAHSIAELAFHALAWVEEVTRRLDGSAPSLPARGDWPSDDAALPVVEAIRLLRHAGDVLDQTLASFPQAKLGEIVGSAERDAPTGTGVTYAVMLHGLAQHNAYHGGQVALLKKALRDAQANAFAPA